MKKKKLFEVSLINKAYSRIIQNTTRFYTSDTALEIGFNIVEVEYSFDSAEIILLNETDRSLVTRELTRNGTGFTYELESDIIEHYGNWAAQLKLEKDEEVYISSPVGFSIENDLYNSRPPKLSEVNTWKNLRATADGLIDDIRSELELVSEKELEREQSESERQSAEAQRKTDHANRSAELAGKADKVVIENLIENGDFSDGFNGWLKVASLDTYIIDEGIITINNSNVGSGIAQHASDYSSGKYYISARYSGMSINIRFRVGLGGAYRVMEYLPNSENMTTYSVITELAHDDVDTLMVVSQHRLSPYKVDTLSIINLTQTFGAGNEPTKEEMDRLIEITGYIDGEYALNNKEMLGHLMKGIREKANKKQEDWITPTLLNGWVNRLASTPVRFRKNEFGTVEIEGAIKGGTLGTTAFTLPQGYGARLNQPKAFGALNYSGLSAEVTVAGNNFTIVKSSTTVWISLEGISYEPS